MNSSQSREKRQNQMILQFFIFCPFFLFFYRGEGISVRPGQQVTTIIHVEDHSPVVADFTLILIPFTPKNLCISNLNVVDFSLEKWSESVEGCEKFDNLSASSFTFIHIVTQCLKVNPKSLILISLRAKRVTLRFFFQNCRCPTNISVSPIFTPFCNVLKK